MVKVIIDLHGTLITVDVEDYEPGVNDAELKKYLSDILDIHLGPITATNIYEFYKELLIKNALDELGVYDDAKVSSKRC